MKPQAPADGNLPVARKRLGNAVGQLIDPKPQLVDGRARWVDSLYIQIVESVSSRCKGTSGSVAGPQEPLWIDAMELVATIDRVAAKMWPLWPLQPTTVPVTVWRLQQLDARTWRPQDVGHIDVLSTVLESLTKKATKLLSGGEKLKHLPSPCPACKTKVVYRVNSCGERVRQPALQITTKGCTCQHCRYTWPPEHFLLLAGALGYERPAGTGD